MNRMEILMAPHREEQGGSPIDGWTSLAVVDNGQVDVQVRDNYNCRPNTN
jgi:hypothetical protein